MIRTFCHGDLPRLRQLLTILHRRSPYAPIKVEWSLVEQMVMQAQQCGAIFVSDRRGKLNGFIVCGMKPLWWNPRYRIGTDIFFLPGSRESGADLLKCLIHWCARQKVVRIECGVSSFTRLEDIRPIYLAAGFKQEGSLFTHSFSEAVCPASSTM